MLRKELVIGFIVAGFADAAVPVSFWRSLFLTGHGFWSVLENVILGPFLAVISFVCSIGNVPLAAALWTGGITFGGTIAFVFADLITLPLLLIYRGYYGTRLTLKLLAVFWATMSTAGLITEYLFNWAGSAPAGARHATDPVCGMQVQVTHAPATARHHGTTYHFCSDHHRQPRPLRRSGPGRARPGQRARRGWCRPGRGQRD